MITPSDNSHLLSADMLNLAGNHLQKSGLHNEAIQLFTKAFWLVKGACNCRDTLAHTLSHVAHVAGRLAPRDIVPLTLLSLW